MKPHTPAADEIDYVALQKTAVDNLQDVLDLVHRSGRPCGALLCLNPRSERTIKHLHVVAHPVWRWINLSGPGEGYDAVSLVEFLADVPRDIAGRFLADHLASAVANRRPSQKPA